MAAVIEPHKAMNFHDFLPACSYLICHFESCNVAIICFVFPFQKVGIFYSFLQSWEITNLCTYCHLSLICCQLTASVSSCFQMSVKSREELFSTLSLQKFVYEILLPFASHKHSLSYPDTPIRIVDSSFLYLEQLQLHSPLCWHIIICPFPAD